MKGSLNTTCFKSLRHKVVCTGMARIYAPIHFSDVFNPHMLTAFTSKKRLNIDACVCAAERHQAWLQRLNLRKDLVSANNENNTYDFTLAYKGVMSKINDVVYVGLYEWDAKKIYFTLAYKGGMSYMTYFTFAYKGGMSQMTYFTLDYKGGMSKMTYFMLAYNSVMS